MDIFFTRTQTAETIPINGEAYGSNATNIYEAILELLSQTNGGPVRIEYRELTATEASSNRLYLRNQPANTNQVGLDVLDGVPQQIGVDFTVNDNILSWDMGELKDLLEPGDILRIMYSTVPEFKVLHYEITQEMLDNKGITLPSRAFYPQQVALDVIGGVYQINGIDFTCDGTTIDWSGTDLEDLLEIGDHIRVSFLG